MRFMTFDVGQHCGWARAEDSGEPTWGLEILPETRDDYGATGVAFENFLLHQFNNVAKPHMVGFASPLIYADQPAGNRKLVGMAFLLETTCKKLGIEVREDYEATMRGYFLAPNPVPRLSADIKAAVMARCADLGWDTQGKHDAADALCCLDFLRSQMVKGWRSAAERSGLFK